MGGLHVAIIYATPLNWIVSIRTGEYFGFWATIITYCSLILKPLACFATVLQNTLFHSFIPILDISYMIAKNKVQQERKEKLQVFDIPCHTVAITTTRLAPLVWLTHKQIGSRTIPSLGVNLNLLDINYEIFWTFTTKSSILNFAKKATIFNALQRKRGEYREELSLPLTCASNPRHFPALSPIPRKPHASLPQVVTASQPQQAHFNFIYLSMNKTPFLTQPWQCYSSGHTLTISTSPNQSVTFLWILIRTNIQIYSCQENDTNEYPNIFVWNLRRTQIQIYSYQYFDTNEYPNKYLDRKYSNVRTYSSLSGLDLHQFRAFTI